MLSLSLTHAHTHLHTDSAKEKPLELVPVVPDFPVDEDSVRAL